MLGKVVQKMARILNPMTLEISVHSFSKQKDVPVKHLVKTEYWHECLE